MGHPSRKHPSNAPTGWHAQRQPRRPGTGPGTPLHDTLTEILRALERRERPLVETTDDEFLDAMVAFEQRLQELVPVRDRRGRDDSLAALIDGAPLPHHQKEQLHDLRLVRNALVHIADVHVGRPFTRAAIQRLRQAAIRLEGRPTDAAALMTREVLAVATDLPLRQVQVLLLQRGISQVAVRETETQRLHGWITQRRLLQALGQAQEGIDAGVQPATTAIAEHGIASVAPDASLDHLVALFDDPDVQGLAVLDGERLEGVVSRSDLLQLAY